MAVPLLLFTVLTASLQPGKLEVSIICCTSLCVAPLPSLCRDISPKYWVAASSLIMPAGNAATPYLSPWFELLHNILITHQLFRLAHKQQPQKACTSRGSKLRSYPPQVILPDHSGLTAATATVGRFKEPPWSVFRQWIPNCSHGLVVLALYSSFASMEFKSLHFRNFVFWIAQPWKWTCSHSFTSAFYTAANSLHTPLPNPPV